jgi:N-acetylmuramoyl-L-alanine amidase
MRAVFTFLQLRRPLPLLTVLLGMAVLGAWWLNRRGETMPQAQQMPEQESRVTESVTTPTPRYRLSPLADAPQWSELDAWQNALTREEFEGDLTRYFTCSERWRDFLEIAEDHVMIVESVLEPKRKYRLNFAKPGEEKKVVRRGRSQVDAAPRDPAQCLSGLHIAIDPGHLGGEWAQMEERWFTIGDGKPVTEGDMTLYVAKLVKPMLEAHGATVSLVREKTQPITPDRPAGLLTQVKVLQPTLATPMEQWKAAESLFYRTSEIRARAAQVNQQLRPDLVLCLHFNAVAWGDPANPALVDENHLHILLHGAYTDDELSYDDQRYEMMRKILQKTIHQEAAVGAVMADVFAEQSGLPPYPYEPQSTRARNVKGHPYLWARNLLANRLYDCPVIFFEPYVMNSREVYERIQVGDYPGRAEVAGKMRKSIYREYADALVEGLLQFYQKNGGN